MIGLEGGVKIDCSGTLEIKGDAEVYLPCEASLEVELGATVLLPGGTIHYKDRESTFEE